MLIYIYVNKLQKLPGKLNIRNKALHIILLKFHLFLNALLKQKSGRQHLICHRLNLVNHAYHNRNIGSLRLSQRQLLAINRVPHKLLVHLVAIIFLINHSVNVLVNKIAVSGLYSNLKVIKHFSGNIRHISNFFFHSDNVHRRIFFCKRTFRKFQMI